MSLSAFLLSMAMHNNHDLYTQTKQTSSTSTPQQL